MTVSGLQHVGVNLDVMEVTPQRVRGDRPYVFADTLRRKGLDKVIEFLEAAGGLSQH